MWIDLTAVAIVVVFVLIGLFTGGMRQLLRLAAAAGAFVAAPWLAAPLRPWLGTFFVNANSLALQGMALIISSAVIYVTLVVIVYLLIERSISGNLILTTADRLLGGALGFAKAAILIVLVGHGLILGQSRMPGEQLEQSETMKLVAKFRFERLLDVEHLGDGILDWMELSPEEA